MRPDGAACRPRFALIVAQADGEVVPAIRMLILANGGGRAGEEQPVLVLLARESEPLGASVAAGRDEFLRASQSVPGFAAVVADGDEMPQVVWRIRGAFVA